MKNVREGQLKKCIFMTHDDYGRLIRNLTNGEVEFSFDFEGISYETCGNDEVYTNEQLNMLLSKHFEVNVTSVHIDDCDYPCVWICYKDI